MVSFKEHHGEINTGGEAFLLCQQPTIIEGHQINMYSSALLKPEDKTWKATITTDCIDNLSSL